MVDREPAVVSRRSVPRMRASGSIDPILPLRGYLLSVGGALLLLLLAADWVLPAPLPNRFAQSEPAMPPIRIHSAVKQPERIVIDTNQLLPKPSDKEISTVASQPGSLDETNAAQSTNSPMPVDDGESRPLTSMTAQVRDSLAQSPPGQGPGLSHGDAGSRPRHEPSRARRGKRPQFARHSTPDRRLGWCGAACRNDRSDTFTLFRLN